MGYPRRSAHIATVFSMWALSACTGNSEPLDGMAPSHVLGSAPTPPGSAAPSSGGAVTPDRTAVPDGLEDGPQATATPTEYRFPLALDTNVVPDANIEIWAAVYRPQNLGNTPHPLVLLMHGAHEACEGPDQDRTTACLDYMNQAPACVSTLVPNHLGYAYLAQKLASYGYIVVSVNNNAIHCYTVYDDSPQQNLARGRLILRHLQILQAWATQGGAPDSLGLGAGGLIGKIDFSQVGLMGHSRGGEGVRSAYLTLQSDPSWQQNLPGVAIRGVFELAPVDGQTGTLFEDRGVPWGVLLPQCDGDVYELQGMRPFDRLLAQPDASDASPKMVFTVWGANHNNANSVWAPEPDNLGCVGADNPPLSEATEQTVVAAAIVNFMRGTVGPESDANTLRMFNPFFDLPQSLLALAHLDRNYANTQAALVLNDFSQFEGQDPNGDMNDGPNVSVDYGPVDDMSLTDLVTHTNQSSARVQWQRAGDDVYYQVNFAGAGDGIDLSTYKTLDWRLTRRDILGSANNPNGPTNFAIQLVDAQGTLSAPLDLATYQILRGPVGSDTDQTYSGVTQFYHVLLQSVRISLSDFQGIDLHHVHAVRFVFNDTAFGEIAIADLIASRRYE